MAREPLTERRMKYAPDDIDRMILTAYTHVPAPSMRQLAAQVGRSFQAVDTRLRWLVEQGYLQRAEGTGPGSARALTLATLGFQFLDPGTYGQPGSPLKRS